MYKLFSFSWAYRISPYFFRNIPTSNQNSLNTVRYGISSFFECFNQGRKKWIPGSIRIHRDPLAFININYVLKNLQQQKTLASRCVIAPAQFAELELFTIGHQGYPMGTPIGPQCLSYGAPIGSQGLYYVGTHRSSRAILWGYL